MMARPDTRPCATPGCPNLVTRLHRFGALHKRCVACEDRQALNLVVKNRERMRRRRELPRESDGC